MTTPDRYGVMGYPVSHSRSPVIHKLFALQTGENIQYELLQVVPEKLEAAVRQFQRTGGKGLNITVPHKQEVVRLCDQLSEPARTAGAVNTLSFRGGEIHEKREHFNAAPRPPRDRDSVVLVSVVTTFLRTDGCGLSPRQRGQAQRLAHRT